MASGSNNNTTSVEQMKREKNLDLMENLEEEKINGTLLHNTMMEIFRTNNVDMSKFKVFQNLIKLEKQMLHTVEKNKRGHFKSHQMVAEYENYNRAIDRLWKYFRHNYSDHKSRVDLEQVLKKQKEINDCIHNCILLIKLAKSK